MRPPAVRVSLSDLGLASGGSGNGEAPSVLLVDDDDAMRTTLTCYFERARFRVAAAATLAEAMAMFATRPAWTLVLADYHLPDGTGLDFHLWMTERGSAAAATPFLLMSGSTTASFLSRGVDFLAKPFTLSQLEGRLRLLLGEKSRGRIETRP